MNRLGAAAAYNPVGKRIDQKYRVRRENAAPYSHMKFAPGIYGNNPYALYLYSIYYKINITLTT